MAVPLVVASDDEHVVLIYDDTEVHEIKPEDAEFLADSLQEAAASVRGDRDEDGAGSGQI